MGASAEHGMRRALARARDGKTLDVAEAEVLLGARGDDLDRLLEAAGRVRDSGLAAAGRAGLVTYSRKVFIPLTRLCRDRCHYCTFATTPGRLRADGEGLFLTPDEVVDLAGRGAALGCKEALVHPGRPARGPLARGGRVARGARLRLDAGLPARDGGPRARGDRAAAAPEPRRPDLGRAAAAEAGRAVHGDDARDDVGAAVGRARPAALRLAGQGARRTPPRPRGRRPLVDPVHHRHPRRHRRDAGRARRGAAGHPRRPRGGTGTCRRSSSRTSGPRSGPRCARSPTSGSRTTSPRSPWRACCSGRGCASRCRRTSPTRPSSGLLLRAGVDDWGGVSPLTPDHVNPERPWPHLDDLARLTADAGFTLVERLTAHPEYVLVARAVARPARAAARRRPRRPRHRSRASRAAAPPACRGRSPTPTGAPWRPDGSTCTSRSTRSDAPATGAPTSTRSTATGRPWASRCPTRPGGSPYGWRSATPRSCAALRRAQDDPAGLTDAEYLALMTATGQSISTRSAPWPTTCAGRWSVTTSPTS